MIQSVCLSLFACVRLVKGAKTCKYMEIRITKPGVHGPKSALIEHGVLLKNGHVYNRIYVCNVCI